MAIKEPALEVDLYRLVLLLDDEDVDPEIQAFLTGEQLEDMTLSRCVEVHPTCVNAVLHQLEFLEKPYYDGVFETPGGRINWMRHLPSTSMMVTLRPISTPPLVIHCAGAGHLGSNSNTDH